MHKEEQIPQLISTRQIYKGSVINLRRDEILNPEGKAVGREVVEHPGGAAVLAVEETGEAYFVLQYRHPVAECLLEIPAGKLDGGENPLDCAIRELAEEVGVKANEIRQIAVYYSTPGFTSEKLYLYLATGLEQIKRQQQEDEDLEVILIPLKEAIDMAKHGKITDGKTLIALLLAEDILKA